MVAELGATFEEEAVVVVELVLGQQVDVVLFEVFQGSTVKILVLETGHIPALDDLLRHGQRGPGVDHGRAAVGAAVGQGHCTVQGLGTAGVDVEPARHLHLTSGVLLLLELRSHLEDRDLDAVGAQRRQLLGRRTAAGTGTDDDNVVFTLLHEDLPCRRAPAHNRPPHWFPAARSSP